MDIRQWTARRGKRARGVLLATALLAAVAGCSSSAATSGQAAGASASHTDRAGVTLAQSRASKYEKPPTSVLSSLPPLKSDPPRNKTIAFVYQDIPQGEAKAAGIKAAAAAVGWTYKQVLVNASDPSTEVAGINQAIQQYHANVVVVTGLTVPEIQSTFSTVTKAGAIIVPQDGIFNPTGPIPAVIGGTPYYQLTGTMLADWVAAKSGGNAHVLFAAIDAFAALAEIHKGFTSELKTVCPGCKVTVAQLTIDQAVGNQGNSVVTSALQRDPSIKYVVTADGALFGDMASSLNTAGLGGKVTIASAVGDVRNQSAILSGQEAVTTGDPNEIMGWLSVDAALRHTEKMSYPSGYGIPPTQLMAKSNSSTWKVGNDYQVPANFADVFKRLWHVSGS